MMIMIERERENSLSTLPATLKEIYCLQREIIQFVTTSMFTFYKLVLLLYNKTFCLFCRFEHLWGSSKLIHSRDEGSLIP